LLLRCEPIHQAMYHHLLSKVKEIETGWKASWIKNTLLIVALLLEEKTCNLWKLKGSVGKLLGNTATDPDSHYQRIKRWLWSGEKQNGFFVEMLRASVSLLKGKVSLLLLDGSSWKWAGRTYHFLTLSVLYRGVSIPIFWLELGRLGISSQWHRKKLLRMALLLFDLSGKVLLADREYIGSEWFKELSRAGIDFAIRLREKNYQQEITLQGRSIEKLENKARARIGRVVWQAFELEGFTYYFVLKSIKTRTGKVEFLRIITTLAPARAVKYYSYRYRIESMFRHLKSNGFELESLHVEKAYKVKMMMAALVLAYSLAVVYGLKKFKRKVLIKKHGSPAMSVFRWGLDKWQNHLQTLRHFLDELAKYFNLWLCPKNDLFYQYVP
jgi:hypothetical protein